MQGSGNHGPRRTFLPLNQRLFSLPRAAGSGDTQRRIAELFEVVLREIGSAHAGISQQTVAISEKAANIPSDSTAEKGENANS